ncbi:MAG: PD-(D/E)XK nuclease family protein, partial [Anaerolineae bacterium]|nr:PD-(D/E)XK nuclease family protein [Anaerolineae bacterium]
DVSSRKREVSQRIIGEMVHEALGWWRFPSEYDDLEGVLKSYAWELGVVDDGQQKYAIQEARKLLRQTMKSDVYRWIEDAIKGGAVYRELPFVFRGERRTIHGVLDVLLRRPDGSWAIVDYKTSYVASYRAINLEALRQHARRFHLQVGVYATAVKEQLGGITPDVYIHYIRYGQSIQVYTGEWELALGKIESYIGNLLDESDWVT